MVFPRKFTFGSGTFSKRNSRISTPASIAMSGFRGLPVPSFFIASGTGDVPDGYEPPGASTLDRGEVQTQLLRPASGGVRGPGLLGAVSPCSLLGLPGCILGLLHGPACHVLSLTSHLSGSLLGLACRLSGSVLRLLGGPTSGVLHALGNLAHLIRDTAERASTLLAAGEAAHSFLCLLGGLARGSALFFHRFGRFDHVADDDTPIAARALDLCEVHAPLLRLAAGRVRGVDLALAPDLVHIEVGYVFL